ncbi:hypothetical protein LPJ71_002655, partial [Coemansia sp. S17]
TAGELAIYLIARFTPFADSCQAKVELEQLKISTTVTAYIKTFNAIVAHIPNMEDEDMRHHFVHGLKKSVHWAVDRASPATLEDAFTVSLTEDIDFVASLSALQTTQQRNLAPQTTAMDVDAIHAPRFNRLTDEEHAYLRSINACFHCRQPGHCSNTCPLNNSHSCQQQFHQCRSPQVNSFEMMPQYYHGYPMSFRPGFMPMYPGYSFPPALPQQQQQPLPGQ